MADIRCSHCGKDNPDFLDVCQFCQSPLKPESMVHIGEEPTKKDTGELEEILPEWLKDARQQGKNEEAADDAFRSQTKPKVPKAEPPDLLAGLMSQSDSEDDEVPDWLAGISPVAEKGSLKPSTKDKDEPSDFFAQFIEPETQPAAPPSGAPVLDDMPSSTGAEEKPSEQKDELTDWFSQAPAESGAAEPEDNSWMRNLGAFEAEEPTEQGSDTEKEPEDLGWLRDLEAASKGTGELHTPKKDAGFDSVPPSSDGDLDWLNNLGGTSASSFEEPAPAQPASSDEDLGWLKDFGGTPAPPADEQPAPSQPASSDEDLDWLNKLGGISAPSEEPALAQPASSDEDLSWLKDFSSMSAPAADEPTSMQPASSDDDLDWLNKLGGTPVPATDEPITSQPTSSQEDLDWLKNLGGTSEPATKDTVTAEPSSSQEDLDWLSDLGGTSEPSDTSAPAFAGEGEPHDSESHADATSKPFRTAPLNELLSDDTFKDTTPDWLKNALEEPSMPAPGAVTMDWFKEQDESNVPTQDEPASSQPAFELSSDDSSGTSAQDVDALFMEMPDWLSQEKEGAETPASGTTSAPASEDDTLSPVELPSWVQAMRPVDSSISDATAGSVDQITEREGPLAGFRGVIPSAPIGSSLRPKAFSLKLQITEEQQASASLLEQIIASETTVQPRKEAAGVSSQKVLRWALSGLFLIVLGIVIGFGSRMMPIVPSNQLSDFVATIPDSSPVLVVVDYEPSFTGELEAAAGPLLDQLALARRSTFTFVSMSPNGSALVDRLMFNTGISRPDGLGYQPGVQYFNLGFLPGGSVGVLGFIENPRDDFAKFGAVILMTDNAETGRVWVEQLDFAKGKYPQFAGKPLIVVSSAQSGPLLQPYVSSGQVDIMINGLYDAAKYEYVNNTRPGTARAYWDAFGFGLMMAIIAIVLGSVWSVFMRIRESRAEAEQG